MARILTDETSLHRKRDSLKKESAVLQKLVWIETGLAAILLATGVALLVLGKGGGGLLAAGIVLGFLAVGHGFKVRENKREHQSVSAGLKGEMSVTQVLNNALGNDSYILNDLSVKHGWKRAQMDHLVVTPRGIFVVETKTWRGEIDGGEDDDTWTQVRRPGDKPIKLRNPIAQCKRQVEVLRLFLKDEGVDWPHVYPILVSRSPEAMFWVRSSTVPLLKPPEAARYIVKQTSDRQYTAEEVTAVIELLKKKGR
ncbi:MAG: NERD domain-containing protein [Kiritimatiellae bacterium]|nr:NERD domain-containing protein [Kiritimatiellia bacterium]